MAGGIRWPSTFDRGDVASYQNGQLTPAGHGATTGQFLKKAATGLWVPATLVPTDIGMPSVVGAPSVWANSGAGALQYIAPSAAKDVLAAPSGLGSDLAFVQLDNTYLANRTRSLPFIPAGAFTFREGAGVTCAVRGSNSLYPAWNFPDAQTSDVSVSFVMPSDYVSGALTINLYVTNLGAGSGNLRWSINLLQTSIAGSGDLNAVGSLVIASQTVAAPNQNILQAITSTVSFTPSNENSQITLLVQRIGADAADTLTNDAGFLGCKIFYTADS